MASREKVTSYPRPAVLNIRGNQKNNYCLFFASITFIIMLSCSFLPQNLHIFMILHASRISDIRQTFHGGLREWYQQPKLLY